MFKKCHIAFFTFICDLLHYSDQLCNNLFHWGWWIYCLTKPYNATHREITLFHGCEHIELRDPIITFEMFIFAIIVGLHIIWNMSWVHKRVTQPFMMWSIPCSIVVNYILLSNVCACENHHNLVFTHVPWQGLFICMCNKIFQWMGISSHKWCWEGVGSIHPKLHHFQGLVGTHGWMEERLSFPQLM
jgi:hypothetical protein